MHLLCLWRLCPLLVCCCSVTGCVQLFVTLWTAACRASLSFTISQSLLKLLSIESVMPSNHVIPFSSCVQSFPASGSFLMSQLFASGSPSIGASVSASVLPVSIQGWFPLGLTGLISFQSKGLSRVFSSPSVWKHQFSNTQPSLWSDLTLTVRPRIRAFVPRRKNRATQ